MFSLSGGVAGRTRGSARPHPLNKLDSVETVLNQGVLLKRTGSIYECKWVDTECQIIVNKTTIIFNVLTLCSKQNIYLL